MILVPTAGLLALATTVSAQYGPGGQYGPAGLDNNGRFGGSDDGGFGSERGGPSQSFIDSRQRMLIAHGVLASLAFVILFPLGSILIRLGSFRGAWLIHGLFQIFAYLVYTAAVGLGIWLAQQAPSQVGLLDKYHPIIGLLLFALLFFQPVMGYIHHLRFKKLQRRTVWSYGHLWLGRIAITLGMINGGLGLLLAYDAPLGFAPSTGQVIAYGIVAPLIWLLYVTAAIVGERRRAIAGRNIDDETRKAAGSESSAASWLAPRKERYGIVMGKPKLALQVPADHTITIPTSDSLPGCLHGTLTFSNVPPECGIEITLVRIGRLKRGKEIKDDTASKKLLGELGFLGSQKEQKQEQVDYLHSEKINQDLRIIREIAGPVRLEPSRTVSFPETTFAVRASFDPPCFNLKNTTIPTTLRLNGLNLPITNSMRMTETRWLVPREVRWNLEETTVLITGCPDTTGHLPMSTAQRIFKKRQIASGKEKLKLKYPFTRPGNTPVTMHPDKSGLSIPFTISTPEDIPLGDSSALAVAGGHVLHTVLDIAANDPNGLQKRFAVYLEYTLHVWLRIGEDVFDETSGDLVNRKMDEMAYTVVCPLVQHSTNTQQGDDAEPVPIVPPTYDGVWEQPPPDYSTPLDPAASKVLPAVAAGNF
ncbi:hypothetical protein E8E12_005828 [Didymella heteroderae]|uniref:Cytochrome b561 domain-containing protein n=1 Tax=Didymella heteroderae TaxID=1769908 RepID=A0A9P4WQ67_9PLEO|nr:hypothetical protein E8E12_005828 [Didymella heteroderae]